MLELDCLIETVPFSTNALLKLLRKYKVPVLVPKQQAMEALATEERIVPYKETFPNWAISVAVIKKDSNTLFNKLQHEATKGGIQKYKFRMPGKHDNVVSLAAYSKEEVKHFCRYRNIPLSPSIQALLDA